MLSQSKEGDEDALRFQTIVGLLDTRNHILSSLPFDPWSIVPSDLLVICARPKRTNGKVRGLDVRAPRPLHRQRMDLLCHLYLKRLL